MDYGDALSRLADMKYRESQKPLKNQFVLTRAIFSLILENRLLQLEMMAGRGVHYLDAAEMLVEGLDDYDYLAEIEFDGYDYSAGKQIVATAIKNTAKRRLDDTGRANPQGEDPLN